MSSIACAAPASPGRGRLPRTFHDIRIHPVRKPLGARALGVEREEFLGDLRGFLLDLLADALPLRLSQARENGFISFLVHVLAELVGLIDGNEELVVLRVGQFQILTQRVIDALLRHPSNRPMPCSMCTT
jgi:hypothetical protein